MIHLMLDLETMGTGNNAAIIAVGAVKFSARGLGGFFYDTIDLADAVKCGLELDPSTVLWWLGQGDEARKEFTERQGKPLTRVLESFRRFLGEPKQVRLWGNGSDFDNVILANAYNAVNMEVPWKFYNNRCYRTMKNMYRDVAMVRDGTHHNALDDAKTQAAHLIEIARTHGLTL